MIRVVVPAHLKTLIGRHEEILLSVPEPVTMTAVLDGLELRYPQLRGTIRDTATNERRRFIRFFGCEEDLSHDPLDGELPLAIRNGSAPLYVVGAMAGG